MRESYAVRESRAYYNMILARMSKSEKETDLKSVGSYSLEGSSPSSRIANVCLHYVGVFKLSFVIFVVHLVSLNEKNEQVMS